MRSECIAAMPQTIYSYTWKSAASGRDEPSAASNHRREFLARAGEKAPLDAVKPENPSVSWKAYLASREFQNLAADLADAIFSAAPDETARDLSRPSILMTDSGAMPGGARPLSGLLAPILPQESIAAAPSIGSGDYSQDLAIAA